MVSMDISKRILWFFCFLAVDPVVSVGVRFAMLSAPEARPYHICGDATTHSSDVISVCFPRQSPSPWAANSPPLLSHLCDHILTSSDQRVSSPSPSPPFFFTLLFFFLLFLFLLSSSSAAVFPLLLSLSLSFFLSFHSYLTHFLPHPVLSKSGTFFLLWTN